MWLTGRPRMCRATVSSTNRIDEHQEEFHPCRVRLKNFVDDDRGTPEAGLRDWRYSKFIRSISRLDFSRNT